MKDHCTALAEVSYTNFAVSLLLLIGILVSYLPQHFRIISRGSSFGLSPYFVLLGTTSGVSGFANILVLPTSREDIACCHVVNGFACFAGLLGIAQVGVQCASFAIMYVCIGFLAIYCQQSNQILTGYSLFLFLIYFPRATPPTAHPDKDPGPTYRTAVAVTGLCLAHAIVVIIVSFYFIFAQPEHLQGWAIFLGIMAAVLASIQYFPQIYTTFRLKRVGSLSIPMMCVQTPGGFLWAGSLAARLGPSGWSQWGIYVVTASMQGILLVLGSYYEIMHRRKDKKDIQARLGAAQTNESLDASEETPLLRSSD